MVGFLFADADEDRDVRAEVGGFEASPADADADAMAEAADPALMPSMASLAPVAVPPNSQQPSDRFFFFFFFGRSNPFFHSEIIAKTGLRSVFWRQIF